MHYISLWRMSVFQNTEFTVEEPEFGSVTVNLPIIRNAGTLGNVTVQWAATINGHPADDDLRVAIGNITFAPGEAIQMLLLEILADDVPEVEEVSRAVMPLLNSIRVLTCIRNMCRSKQEMLWQEAARSSDFILLVIIFRNGKNCLAALFVFLFFLFEIVHVELTQASNGGAIGLDGMANIVIPANDNPYGTVFFHQSSYRIQEPLERNLLANISVRRRSV